MKIKMSAVRPSRFQKSDRRVSDIESLKENIQRNGLMQRPKVRPISDGEYEVVFGHRRIAALSALGYEELAVGEDVQVEVMTDDMAIEQMLVENLQREDLDPFEEAENLAFMQESGEGFGGSLDEIAARIGKPASYVRRRAKLAGGVSQLAKSYRKGILSLGACEKIAVFDGKTQRKAVMALADWWKDDDNIEGVSAVPITARHAMGWLRDNAIQEMSLAPWDLADDKLVTAAGACDGCAKRGGSQLDLIPGRDTSDVCLDVACWTKKHNAFGAKQLRDAKKAGGLVLEGEKGADLFHAWGGLKHDSGYVKLATPCPRDPDRRSYGELLPDAQRTIAVDSTGRVHELLPSKGMTKRLRDAGHEFAKPEKRTPADKKHSDELRKQKAVARFDEQVEEEKVRSVTTAAEKWASNTFNAMKHSRKLLEILASEMREHAWRLDEQAKRDLAQYQPAQLFGYMIEIALRMEQNRGGAFALKEAVAVFKVSEPKLRKEMKAYLKSIEKK
jgi:ParB/RepB/Spo0J family partition protein